MEPKSSKVIMFNLVILGVAIILVAVAKNNYGEFFGNIVNSLTMAQKARLNYYDSPIPNQLYAQYHFKPYQYLGPMDKNGVTYKFDPYNTNSNLKQQPMVYPQQLYPAKAPWYPQAGRPCETGSCGATGVCKDGVCHRTDGSNTVFNINTSN